MNPPHGVQWFRVAAVDELPEGRVKSVMAGHRSVCLSNVDGQWAAMDKRCPHQGGPLGEGSIERGAGGQCWIRCPWHGWDFDPLTGKPPGGHEDSGQTMDLTELRDGAVFVGLAREPAHERTVTNVMAETLVNWGVKHVFGMVGHSNLGLADAIRRRTVAGEMRYISVRHEGAAAFANGVAQEWLGSPMAAEIEALWAAGLWLPREALGTEQMRSWHSSYLSFGLKAEPPAPKRQYNRTHQLAELMAATQAIDEGRSVAAHVLEQLDPGTSMGGARPKATIENAGPTRCWPTTCDAGLTSLKWTAPNSSGAWSSMLQ
jgi:nitrite reductase/ring-hydroxylating ferredoxin subunit